MSNPDTLAIIDIRRRAQSEYHSENFRESLSLYTESLSRSSTDPIAFIERAMVYSRLSYPELELCDARRAHQIFTSIGDEEQYLTIAYNTDQHIINGNILLPDAAVANKYRNDTYKNICYSLASSLTNLQLYGESIQWCEKCANLTTDAMEKQKIDRRIQNIKQHITINESGGILGSTTRYPWDRYNIRKNNPTTLLNNIQPTIAQGSCLTVRKIEIYSSDEQFQFGIFTTDHIKSPQTLFMETEILCVNMDITLVCDNCNRTLPDDKYFCPHCQTAYCNKHCYLTALTLYHRELCSKDTSALLHHINKNTKSLIPLLILKLFAISKMTQKHPLSLPYVCNLTNIEYKTNILHPYSLRSLDNYMTIIGILDLRQFRSDFDYWIYLTLDNILTSNIFACKTSDGLPWKAYILPHIAMFNHSCTPNARLSLEGAEAKIIASSTLQTGDEVVISYIDNMASVEERQKILLHGWGFVCRCAKCIEEGQYKNE